MQTNLTGEMMDVNRLDSRGNVYLGAGESIESFDGSAMLINDAKEGPMLINDDMKVLWRAFPKSSGHNMPGRLYMQGDGNLVFYDNSNACVWASDTTASGPATSMLILEGQSEHRGLRLYIYNYAKKEVSAVLYTE